MHGRYGGDLGRATGSVGAGRRCLGGREQGPTLILHAGQELKGDEGQGGQPCPTVVTAYFQGLETTGEEGLRGCGCSVYVEVQGHKEEGVHPRGEVGGGP